MTSVLIFPSRALVEGVAGDPPVGEELAGGVVRPGDVQVRPRAGEPLADGEDPLHDVLLLAIELVLTSSALKSVVAYELLRHPDRFSFEPPVSRDTVDALLTGVLIGDVAVLIGRVTLCLCYHMAAVIASTIICIFFPVLVPTLTRAQLQKVTYVTVISV